MSMPLRLKGHVSPDVYVCLHAAAHMIMMCAMPLQCL